MRTALVFVILGLLARWTTAEINEADTIDWITIDSDIMTVGKVTQVSQRPGPGRLV